MQGNEDSKDHNNWKGSTWVYFVALIQVSRSKKAEERKRDLRDVIATATDDIDNFVYWLRNRSDVYELDSFASEMSNIMDRIIHFRNVHLFTALSSGFLPVYLRYLGFTAEAVTQKDVLRLLEVLLLSYPLPRRVLKEIQPELITFKDVIVSVKKVSVQTSYAHLYQCLCYLYPDLHLYSALSCFPVPYKEREIAATVRNRFLYCWSLAYLPENPPNGEYFSDDDDTIVINGKYCNPLWVANVPLAPLSSEICWGEQYSVMTDRSGVFFSEAIHLSKGENMAICVFESNQQVLYWSCPKCSAKNTTRTGCSVCGEAIPGNIASEGFSKQKCVYPSLFVNSYYMTQSSNPMIPNLYIRYPIAKASPCNLLKPNMSVSVDPIFHLYPTYTLTPVYSPERNAFNGIYVSYILPHDLKTPTTILRSDILTITNLGDNPNRLCIKANTDRVRSLKVLSHWKHDYSSVTDLCYEMEIDLHLILNIRFVVVESQLVMLEVHNDIIKLRLNEPMEETHLAHVSVVNEPETAELGLPYGVLGVYVYHISDKQNWGSIPMTAAAFSMIGCHIGPECGLYSLTEERTSVPRCTLLLKTSGVKNHPWLSFMHMDQRLEYHHTNYLISEFSYYNETCCFDQYVDWTSTQILFGRGARLGLLYWKSSLYAQKMAVEFNVSWPLMLPGFCMWWICTTALPRHRLLTVVALLLMQYCNTGSLEPVQIDIPFYIQSSIACILLNRNPNRSVAVRYVRLTSRERCVSGERDMEISPSVQEIHCLDVSAAEEVQVQNELSLQVATVGNHVVIRAGDKLLFANSELLLPFVMCQPQAFVLSGFAGSFVSVSRYEVASAAEHTSFILVPSTDTTLYQVAMMSPRTHFNTAPCHVTYQDRISYGSADPALSNPILYKMNGYTFMLDETSRNYGVFAWNQDLSLLFYMELHESIPSHSFVTVNRGMKCTVKRVKTRRESEMSCFTNNRLVKFGCNSSGLINHNNTCFQNSALQLLFHSDSFKRSLFRFYHEYIERKLPQDNENFLCTQSLVLMLTRLQVSIRAAEFNNLMLLLQKHFDLGYQHDMSEYTDYLLSAIDNCYETMKKAEGECTIPNPFLLFEGKQQERISCFCGQLCEKTSSKPLPVQTSYITLTSPLYPVTNIQFESYDYNVKLDRPFTTFILVCEYHKKGVFMAVERNPNKPAFSSLTVSTDRRRMSTNRITSFHSYSSSYLSYELFSEDCEALDANFVGTGANQLVVDVLVREILPNMPQISQTNNGNFDCVGSFSIEDVGYELYQKVVTFRESQALNDFHRESCPNDAVFSLQHVGSLPPATMLLPSELSSSTDYLRSISSSFSVMNSKEPERMIQLSSMTGAYPLFYCDTTPDKNSVTIQDEDGLDHYGVFVNDTLMGTWAVQKETIGCLSSFFQLIDKNKTLISGTMILFLEHLLVFDESFGIVSYPCVTVEGCLESIQVNEKWYILVDESSKTDNVKTCIYQCDDQCIQIILSTQMEECTHHSIIFTNAKSVSIEGFVLMGSQMTVFVPKGSHSTGVLMKLHRDETFMLEWYGEYASYTKNRRSTVPCLVLHYAPVVIHSSLYLPEVTVLSIESMGLASLGLTAEDRRARECTSCHTSVCRRCEFTEYPTYLRFNISRTYFDESTYQLQKDCSFVSVNPSLTIGTEVYSLYAIVVHVGASFDSGHYIVYCRHSDDGENMKIDNQMNQWNLYNDDTVYSRDWKEILIELSDYGTCPYCVVYCRTTLLTSSTSIPGYHREGPYLDEYDTACVDLMEERNNQILLEVGTAPFLLKKQNQSWKSRLVDIDINE